MLHIVEALWVCSGSGSHPTVPRTAGALKLVGEMMPWEAASQFVFTQDNHNSVLGIRNLANAAGASSLAVTMQSAQGRDAVRPQGTGDDLSRLGMGQAEACTDAG